MLGIISDRRGTATIEFAFVAPIMVLLVIGLADGVRRNLMMIDLDAVAHTGACATRAYGLDSNRIADVVAAQDVMVKTSVALIDCTNAKISVASCAGLPAGRYARVTTTRDLSTLFAPFGDSEVRATAMMRLL
jgi:Flp pilus assembly protein TadG